MRVSLLSPRREPTEVEDRAAVSELIRRQRVGRRGRRARMSRVRRSRRALIGIAAVVTVALAAGALGGGWLLTAARFAVVEVEVRGNSRLTRERILDAVAIEAGVNLFRLDARTALSRVEAMPEVRRAELIRSLPNRVTLVVEERRPFTLVHAGRLHWVDEAGIVIGRETRAVPLALPVISGLTPDELARAGRAPSGRVTAGVSLIRNLLRSGSPLLQHVSEIDVGRAEGPVLYMVDGVEVRLGAEDWEARLPRLQGVLAQVAASGQAVTSIDLRFRDQVVLKTAGR